MKTDPSEAADGDIQSVIRCAQVLRMFSPSVRSVRVAEAAEHLGVGRTTAHRYLTSMAGAGLLVKAESGPGYGLGPLMADMGTLAINDIDVVTICDPYLRELADAVSGTSVLTVWGTRTPVVVRTALPRRLTVNITIRVGHSLNLDAAQSSVFGAFRADDGVFEQRLDELAELDEPRSARIRARVRQTRETGIAISDTINVGTRAAAAPVFDHTGAIVASIGIVGTIQMLSAEHDSGQIKALRDTATRLTQAIGGATRPEFEPAPTTR